MKSYRYSDLYIGLSERFQRTVTEEMMANFRDGTGDFNPLHNSDSFATEHGYRGRVVYGMLTASFVSTLCGMYLPGEFCIIEQVEIKCKAPVYIGDTITVKGTVKELNDSVRQAVIAVEMRNGEGIKVARGMLYVGFTEE